MEVIRREDVQSRCASSDVVVSHSEIADPRIVPAASVGSASRGDRLRDVRGREVQGRPDEADQLTRDGRDDQGFRFVARTEAAIPVTEPLLGLDRNGQHRGRLARAS